MVKIKIQRKLASFKSKSGEHALTLRARVYIDDNIKEVEIPVLDNDLLNLKMTKEAFKMKKFEPLSLVRINLIEQRFSFAIRTFISKGEVLRGKELKHYVYDKLESRNTIFNEAMTKDAEAVEFFQVEIPDENRTNSVPKEVVDKFSSLDDEDFINEETGEIIDHDLVASNLLSDYYERKSKDEIENMDFQLRYQKGHFNMNNIFDLFGWCLSINPLTGSPWVSKSYMSLIVRLADYRANRNPSEDVNKFNTEWIKQFLLFLKQEGYSVARPKTQDPFKLNQYAKDFRKSKRQVYTLASFTKLVKWIKFYVKVLQKEEFIKKSQVYLDDINVSDFIKKVGVVDKVSHHLVKSEVETMLNTKFSGDLETARIMFLFQVFAGGLRNEELYNKHFKLRVSDDGQHYFSYYSSKTEKIEDNPLIKGYSDSLLKQTGYQLPTLLREDQYRKQLKELADEIGFNRVIRYKQQRTSDESAVLVEKRVDELFAPYFARKTFVNFCAELGWDTRTIQQFTGHTQLSTIEKNYLDRMNLQTKTNELKKRGF